MQKKTRYLQISDIIMFEIDLLGEGDPCNIEWPSSFLTTRLKDGHVLLYSPIAYECARIPDDSQKGYKYKPLKDPLSINTLNHLAVPADEQCSEWYTFLDPDYRYVNKDIENDILHSQIKARQYDVHEVTEEYTENGETKSRTIRKQYTKNAFRFNSAPLETYYSQISDVRWDTAKLYFVNGYDFSNIYGFMMRIYVERNPRRDASGNIVMDESTRYLDLCDIFITKADFYNLVKYMANPIIFGNNIYDRYIEVNFACLYDLIKLNEERPENSNSLAGELDIKPDTTIKLSFAYILEDDVMQIDRLQYTNAEKIEYDINDTNDKVNCTFTRSSVLNGTIPKDEINSDHLGAYIAECTDAPYLVFYATWRDKPLTKGIVWQFNKGIRLYDTSLIKKEYDYEVDRDYEVNHDMRKWMCMHEIKCSFCMGEEIVKEETYSMNQVFISDTDPYIFYYRPVIFDESVGMYIDNVQIVYTIRFMNVNDKVQFIKTSTMSLYGDLTKYYMKGTTLRTSQLVPYKIYNKIIENKHEHVGGNTGPQKTKYVKVFYNSTEVVLDENGNVTSGNYNYTLTLSQAPKSYKFTFKMIGPNGTYSYMDLSNGYYKLLFKDAEGNDNLIEPTYSKNMNLYVGELEFNINGSMLTKLNDVPEGDKKMSIVNYNEDGSVSSMFDMLYN